MTQATDRSIASPPRTRRRLASMALLFATVSALLLLVPIHDFILAASQPGINGYGAVDYNLYMDATRRWLASGSFYEPYQLVGTYPITVGAILYPPMALILFVPFTMLPAILWWLIPLAITVWAVIRLRPAFWTWPFLALCLAWPPTLVKLVGGNPVLWAVAALALGVIYRGPSVLVLIKPSLFPFALFGVWSRMWWVTLGTLIAVSLPFGVMWLDWLRTVVNSQGGGLTYSIQEVPMLALPLIAWTGRRRVTVACA